MLQKCYDIWLQELVLKWMKMKKESMKCSSPWLAIWTTPTFQVTWGPGTQLPHLWSVLCDWIFSLCSTCSLLPAHLVSLQDALPTLSSILQHSFSVTELFYPTCLWSFIEFPSWAEGLILLFPHLELGSDTQVTKALNGLCSNPGSSSAHALMLQPLPSRSFLLKEPLCFSYDFRIPAALYKACPVRKALFHSADTWLYPQPLAQC